jgi:hypothetical protein
MVDRGGFREARRGLRAASEGDSIVSKWKELNQLFRQTITQSIPEST